MAEGEVSPQITGKKSTEEIAASVIQSYFCKFLDRLAEKKHSDTTLPKVEAPVTKEVIDLPPADPINNSKAIDSTHTLQLDDESYRDDAFDPASAKSEEATGRAKTRDAVSRSDTK